MQRERAPTKTLSQRILQPARTVLQPGLKVELHFWRHWQRLKTSATARRSWRERCSRSSRRERCSKSSWRERCRRCSWRKGHSRHPPCWRERRSPTWSERRCPLEGSHWSARNHAWAEGAASGHPRCHWHMGVSRRSRDTSINLPSTRHPRRGRNHSISGGHWQVPSHSASTINARRLRHIGVSWSRGKPHPACPKLARSGWCKLITTSCRRASLWMKAKCARGSWWRASRCT